MVPRLTRFHALLSSSDSHETRCRRRLWCFLAVLFILTGTGHAGPLQLHPRGEALPTQQQGPFVTTGDGGILCIDATQAHQSRDEGKTWTSTPLFQDTTHFKVSDERVLLRTQGGTVIAAWMNLAELHFPKDEQNRSKWGGTPQELEQWVLPTYVCRSLDDGKTWEEPMKLQTAWCGCLHSMIQMKSGRIVLVGQTVIPEWRHATIIYVSDDDGKTWQTGSLLDYGVGRHDHAGSCEATVLERNDGSLWMLLRTESGFFFEAQSTDGLLWTDLKKSDVPSVTCCGNLYRLSDGRAALLWNHPLRSDPKNGHSREELSIAFSSDDGRTWQDRTVIGTRYRHSGDTSIQLRLSYPYLYERHPGELWITTMQGGMRMRISTSGITAAEIPLPQSIVFLGDSTTAYRPPVLKQVVSDMVDRQLMSAHPERVVLNRGVGGNTTADGLKRLQAEIDQLQMKILVIQFGINDAAIDLWKNPPATAPRVSAKDYEANLRTMISLAREKGACPILMTTTPIRWTDKLKSLYGKAPYDPETEEGFERPVLSHYNNIVRKVAAELNVPLVDVHAAWQTHSRQSGVSISNLLLDGLHPNEAGHTLTAQALLPVIQKELSGKPE